MKTTGPVELDRRTRHRVARSLLEHGPSTAAELADRLGLTPAAIRRHLDGMLADGTILAREERPRGPRGRGRPARRFVLTDAGHVAAGRSSYDPLAKSALGYLREVAGDAAVGEFGRRWIQEWEARYTDRISALPLAERPAALAEALSADGFTSTVHDTSLGVQVCQHHCPVQHVAEEFPELCEAETEAIGRLVGSHVQRLATLARGNGVCTTHIPLTEITTSATPTPSSERTAP